MGNHSGTPSHRAPNHLHPFKECFAGRRLSLRTQSQQSHRPTKGFVSPVVQWHALSLVVWWVSRLKLVYPKKGLPSSTMSLYSQVSKIGEPLKKTQSAVSLFKLAQADGNIPVSILGSSKFADTKGFSMWCNSPIYDGVPFDFPELETNICFSFPCFF